MISPTFTLEVAAVDPDRAAVTFKIRSADRVRRMAVSRFFVLRTLALCGRGDYAICRALKPLTAKLSLREQGEWLGDLQNVDRFIARTRVTAIENYIDWENIDHDAGLERMISALPLPTSYHLEVVFREPGHLARVKVGDVLKTQQTDGDPQQLAGDPTNIYTFKRDDEHWRLHALLSTYNTGGEQPIAWTDAHAAVLARIGLLPWQEGGRWGAVDGDGATIVPCVYADVDCRDGDLVFRAQDGWISAAELRAAPPAELRSALADPAAPITARADLDVALLRQRPADAKAVMRASTACLVAQLDSYGLSIAQLLRCWIRVFSLRPDVHVLHDTAGPPVDTDTFMALAGRLPADALALAAELGPLHFCWVFADKLAAVGEHAEGHDGGRVNLVGFAGLRWCAVDDGFDAAFDDLQAEGRTLLWHAVDTSPDTAELVFVHRGERHPYGTVEHYLTRGAGAAFVWYWPKRDEGDARELVARLVAASLPRTTSADEVVARLRARGLEQAQAQALQRWLGPDATLLLPV